MINEAGERGERVVVATVAHTRGSTPQQRGAKMLFFQDGQVAGTVLKRAKRCARAKLRCITFRSLPRKQAKKEWFAEEQWIYLWMLSIEFWSSVFGFWSLRFVFP